MAIPRSNARAQNYDSSNTDLSIYIYICLHLCHAGSPFYVLTLRRAALLFSSFRVDTSSDSSEVEKKCKTVTTSVYEVSRVQTDCWRSVSALQGGATTSSAAGACGRVGCSLSRNSQLLSSPHDLPSAKWRSHPSNQRFCVVINPPWFNGSLVKFARPVSFNVRQRCRPTWICSICSTTRFSRERLRTTCSSTITMAISPRWVPRRLLFALCFA